MSELSFWSLFAVGALAIPARAPPSTRAMPAA